MQTATAPVSCALPKCPTGYKALPAFGTKCGYQCYTELKANCADPELAAPRTCGGVTGKVRSSQPGTPSHRVMLSQSF